MITKKQKALMLSAVLILFSIIFYSFINHASNTVQPPPASGNISNDFLIGSMDNAWDMNFTYIHDTIGFNLWHKYCANETIGGKIYPAGWLYNGAPNDKLFTDESYASQVTEVLDNINSHNMKALMHRPKLEYLCYGQRSDYQCEPLSSAHDTWFYSFNDHPTGGLYVEPNGDSVMFCRTQNSTTSGSSWHNAGYVVKRLKTNTEQCHTDVNDGAGYRWDSQCDWLIKPRIRIDSAFANNPANFNTPVCNLTVKNQDGNTFKEVILRVRHFLVDTLSTYKGRYIEEYTYLAGDSTLTYTGAWGDWWVYGARGNAPNDDNCNKADIQVYWYSNCDMWLDYVRVDNDVAHNLFGTGQTHDIYMDWIQWEAQDIGCCRGGYKQFIMNN